MTPDWHIKSSIQEINWPALPTANSAARLATLYQLQQSQWWPADKLLAHQLQQIRTLLRHCIDTVPYYRRLLANNVMPETLGAEEWRQIPILSRETVQQLGEQLRTEQLPRGHGKAWLQRTSGSTGKPVETLGTEITAFFWNVFTLRDHLWHRRDLGGKLAVIRYAHNDRTKPPHGQKLANWGQATTNVIETGSCSVLSIFSSIHEQATWLVRENPDYLLTHPSVVQELARHCQREKISLPALREVRTLGEALPDGLRELCQEVWGVNLVDIYSTIEAGYLALQCPEHKHYHVQSESTLVEILDEAGNPCKPGEVGRVVVTTLHNFATPLLRYEVGDYAEVGEPCDCGRGLPVIKRIQGRYRNLLTLPSGERRFPKLGIQELYKIAPVQQFQAVQTTLNEIELRLVLPRPLRDEETDALMTQFSESFGPVFTISIKQVDKLERSAGGKYEEFLSQL
jgi:phenylacetate-CoA ligase